MSGNRQLQSIRDTAFQLSLMGEAAWHAESGIRGQVFLDTVDQPQKRSSSGAESAPGSGHCDFSRPIFELAGRAFMRGFLCMPSQPGAIVDAPWRTFGFSFAAAKSGCRFPTVKQEEDLQGIGHSFIYGDRASIEKLARLVAMPAVRYMSNISDHGWMRENSWGDPMTALGDWIYMIYEVGLKVNDPNLRRFYRLITPFSGHQIGTNDTEILCGFDGAFISQTEIHRPRLWKMLWSAASKGDLGFARLGTDLSLASRIALDHLIDSDPAQISNRVFLKWEGLSRYDWAKQAELVRATEQVLCDGSLNKGVLSKACGSMIETNSRSGPACLVNVHSFLKWIKKKKQLGHDEVLQIRNAIIGEIISRCI